MHDLNWKRALRIKDDEMVKIFDETISNTLINYIHHENVSLDDQDISWIDNKIKKLLHAKNEFCNKPKPTILRKMHESIN